MSSSKLTTPNRIAKREAVGIHGIVFYELYAKLVDRGKGSQHLSGRQAMSPL
jgi:hypothetical protein